MDPHRCAVPCSPSRARQFTDGGAVAATAVSSHAEELSAAQGTGCPSTSSARRPRLSIACFPLLVLSSAALAVATVGAQAPTTRYDSSFVRSFNFVGSCVESSRCQLNSDGSIHLSSYSDGFGVFQSKSYYMHGKFSVDIKFPSGYSGGMLPAFFLVNNYTDKSSPDYFEIDFEFLGAENSKDIIIHTNLYTGGYQYLQQFSFAFDPAADFHTYTLIWNKVAVAWLIDNVPIRVTLRNPSIQWINAPLVIEGSCWDSSAWSALKSNYVRTGPVGVTMRRFDIFACRIWNRWMWPLPTCATDTNSGWLWNRRFTKNQAHLNRKYRAKHLINDFGWNSLWG